ncbi:MAG: hypothetical protein EBT75_06725 [Proteobacteria bacterium]|nr:hypothetical protein [Pseudomonadota bacterium]NBX56826.1 hypothetical protein [Betaproteobacteria bacterium]NBX78018.1 hypothetical protein [bacterium]
MEFVMQILGVLITAAVGACGGALGAYVAIKSDLAAVKARLDNLEKAADKAHDRIDGLMK